jgi:uncharacterized protein with GYD domain
MPKYLFEADYSAEGTKGLLKEGGTKRREAVEKAVAGLGGRVETFYFTFGLRDAIVIAELPDNVTAAAMSIAVGASGAVVLKTTPLLSTAEIDQATKKKTGYRAPGA